MRSLQCRLFGFFAAGVALCAVAASAETLKLAPPDTNRDAVSTDAGTPSPAPMRLGVPDEGLPAQPVPASDHARLRPIGDAARGNTDLVTVHSTAPTASGIAPTAGEVIVGTSADAPPLEPIPQDELNEPVAIEPASFNDVVPGVTTLEEVDQAWGVPKEMTKHEGMDVRRYSVESFDRVEVSCYQGKVVAIVIRFKQRFSAAVVARELGLSNIRPVLITDARGNRTGQVYPERGVLFAFAQPDKDTPEDGTDRVSEIILEAITAEPFVIRAERMMKTDLDLALRDANSAIRVDPNTARAHWIRAKVMVTMGDPAKAHESAAKAVEIEPRNSEYRMLHARILGQIGRMSEAIAETNRVLDISRGDTHMIGRAYCQLGDLMASGARPDYAAAIRYHMQAISTVASLIDDPDDERRLDVKKLLVDAHLGAAYDVAWGTWRDKEASAKRWLELAAKHATDIDENEGGGGTQAFRVAGRALGACVGLRGRLDPEPYAEEAIRTGRMLVAATEDPMVKAQHNWDLGMALYDTLQTYQMQGNQDKALQYGERAIEAFEVSGTGNRAAGSDYIVGRLYFRLGAIYAIRDKNHRAAIEYFDKAVPLLQQPLPSTDTDLGRHGETFVSMGVSYWKSGQREMAIEVTEFGVELMEEAVRKGQLARSALAVPYNNLVSMHRQLGSDSSANRYEQLVESIDRATPRR